MFVFCVFCVCVYIVCVFCVCICETERGGAGLHVHVFVARACLSACKQGYLHAAFPRGAVQTMEKVSWVSWNPPWTLLHGVMRWSGYPQS